MKEPVRPDENTELPRTRRLSFISRYDSRCSGRDAFNLRREESKKVYILKRILSGEKWQRLCNQFKLNYSEIVAFDEIIFFSS